MSDIQTVAVNDQLIRVEQLIKECQYDLSAIKTKCDLIAELAGHKLISQVDKAHRKQAVRLQLYAFAKLSRLTTKEITAA
jgi:hypothetical protein